MKIRIINYISTSKAEFFLGNGIRIEVECQNVNNSEWEIDERIVDLLEEARRFITE
jgi:hypothetical protein